MEIESYQAILTEQAWLLRIYHNLPKENIFVEKKHRRSHEMETKANLARQVARGAFSCPLEEPARDKREVRIKVTSCLTPNVNFLFHEHVLSLLVVYCSLYLP